jgi:hypothetical protein
MAGALINPKTIHEGVAVEKTKAHLLLLQNSLKTATNRPKSVTSAINRAAYVVNIGTLGNRLNGFRASLTVAVECHRGLKSLFSLIGG